VRLPPATASRGWRTLSIIPKTSMAIAEALQSMGMNRFASRCPAFIVVTEDAALLSATVAGKFKSQDFAAIDIGIMAAHIVLMATDLGLGSCIIGWFDEDRIKDVLKIEKKRRVRLVIAIGYSADTALRPKVRKSLEKTSFFID